MGSRPARSQGTADPGTDDDEGSAGSSAGSALVAPASASAKKPWLVEHLTRVLQSKPALGRAKIAVAVTDLSSGEELFVAGADQKLNLASNTKLLTSIAALSVLGNGFRWRTAVL